MKVTGGKMNKFQFMGRLTRDPEIRYSQSNEPIAIARFALAINRIKQGNENSADFFNITCFGKLAEIAEKYLIKGSKIVVCGHIRNDTYTNRNGERRYSNTFIADELFFCENKTTNNALPEEPELQSDNNEFMNIPDDIAEELPFN